MRWLQWLVREHLSATHNYSLDAAGLHIERYSKVTEESSGFDYRNVLVARKPAADTALRPPVRYAEMLQGKYTVGYAMLGRAATARIAAQEAMAPICSDAHRFDPKLLEHLDEQLFDNHQRLFLPSAAESFLAQWHDKLGRPSLVNPTRQAFERGIRTVFNTILSGPFVHGMMRNVLNLPDMTVTTSSSVRPKWLPPINI